MTSSITPPPSPPLVRPDSRPPKRTSTVNSNGNPPGAVTSKGINRAIVEAFARPNTTDADMERLRLFLEAHVEKLNQVNVITLMHRCGKHKRDVFAFAPQEVLVRLLDVRAGVASSQGIANALYALRGLSDASPGALPLLRALTAQLGACREILDGQAVSNALYGLQGMSSGREEVRSVLAALVAAVRRGAAAVAPLGPSPPPATDTAGAAGAAPEAPDVAVAVAVRMTPQGLGSAFLGLQSMSSEHAEVRAVLRMLTASLRHLDTPHGGGGGGGGGEGRDALLADAGAPAVPRWAAPRRPRVPAPGMGSGSGSGSGSASSVSSASASAGGYVLDPQAAANILLGLRGCSSRHVEVMTPSHPSLPRCGSTLPVLHSNQSPPPLPRGPHIKTRHHHPHPHSHPCCPRYPLSCALCINIGVRGGGGRGRARSATSPGSDADYPWPLRLSPVSLPHLSPVSPPHLSPVSLPHLSPVSPPRPRRCCGVCARGSCPWRCGVSKACLTRSQR